MSRDDEFRVLWGANVVRSEIADRLGFPDVDYVQRHAKELGLPNRTGLEGARRVTASVERPCITCSAKFQSQHIHNRMCVLCRTNSDLVSHSHPGVRVSG